MAFTPQFLDELRARLSLASVVGRRVRLQKKGREYLGLCPFHNEKTPSFTLNEEKGFFHCFGCGAHGGLFDFVMRTEGLGFPEAVERLAAEAGLEVPRDSPEARRQAERQKTLYGVLEAAARYYARLLRMPEGRPAMAYLERRGVGKAAIETFGLGFALDSRGALRAALAREGIGDEALIEVGLVKKPDDGRPPFDYFRGRLMFPIADQRGRVIAFGGRVLGDGEPKYLNSPDTPLFNKGRTLYGLAQAQDAARRAGTVIVTEGYMDVIALHEAGFTHAVAPLGTALTEDQLGALWRLVPEPVLCFDGDAAGQRAAGRAAERALPLLRPGWGLRFAILPMGEDPDSLIRKRGAGAMVDVIAQAMPLSEALWVMEAGLRPPETPEARAGLEARLRRHAERIADSTVRAHFQAGFRRRLWPERPMAGSRPAAAHSIGRGGREGARGGAGAPVVASPGLPTAKAPRRSPEEVRALHETILLAVLINHPELYDQIGERLGMTTFSGPTLDKLRQEVLKTVAAHPGLDRDGLERHLKQTAGADALADILSLKVYEHAFFAKPGVAADTAREGWEETYALYKKTDLRVEIEEARRRLAEDMSERSYALLRTLKDQEHAAGAGEHEHEGERRKGGLPPDF